MKLSFNLYPTVILIGVTQGFIISFMLFVARKGNRAARIFLGLLILCFSLAISNGFLFYSNIYYKFPLLIGIPEIFRYLFGPFFYLYAKALMSKKFIFKKTVWLHFIPAVLFTMYRIPLYFNNGYNKIQWMLHRSPIFAPDPAAIDIIIEILFPLHVLLYLLLILPILRSFQKEIGNIFSTIDKINLNWVRQFTVINIFIFFLFFCSIFFLFLFHYSIQPVYKITYVSVPFLIFITGYWGMVQPEIFSEINMPVPGSGKKYKKSALSTKQSEIILEKLESAMKSEKYYLDPNLTLPLLAGKISISPQHLSQVINAKTGRNFYEYVNAFRVEEFKKQISDPGVCHLNILAIAYDCGFNSKSTFNSIFKKNTGFTPSEYQRSLQV
jgi:AraC-like DNA-binding protein